MKVDTDALRLNALRLCEAAERLERDAAAAALSELGVSVSARKAAEGFREQAEIIRVAALRAQELARIASAAAGMYRAASDASYFARPGALRLNTSVFSKTDSEKILETAYDVRLKVK